MTVRGRPTGPAAVSPRWRGPTPDPSIRRLLEVGTGYARIPESMLHQGLPDLGVLLWAQLRLWFDDRPGRTNYRELADALGLGALTDKAIELRFRKVVAAMREAGLIHRTRLRDNQVSYQAVTPDDSRRWAVIRRRDIAQLTTGYLDGRGRRTAVSAAHLCDFARWQLECRDRGWCADPSADMAARWSVSTRTFRTRRDALHDVGLIRVMQRAGHADLVWLGELVDPHWMVPSEREETSIEGGPDAQLGVAEDEGPTFVEAGWRVAESEGPGLLSRTEGVAETEGLTLAGSEGAPWQKSKGPIEESLTIGLSVDLTGLGGASATPLTSLTPELDDAAPQAAPSQGLINPRSGAGVVAGRLLSEHRYLTSAAPHFRAAMLQRMTRALQVGLDSRHLARALQRVIDDAARDAHCELVRLAVQQAWADQRGGVCAECGGELRSPTTHTFGCTARRNSQTDPDETPAVLEAAITASLEAARSARAAIAVHSPVVAPAGSPDPLDVFLRRRPTGTVPDWTEASDAELLDWLSAALAEAVVSQPVAFRLRALQRAWVMWRPKVPTGRRDVLDVAAAQLRRHLEQPDHQQVPAAPVASVG